MSEFRKIRRERHPEIIERLKAGERMQDIGADFGVNRNQIRRIAALYGVQALREQRDTLLAEIAGDREREKETQRLADYDIALRDQKIEILRSAVRKAADDLARIDCRDALPVIRNLRAAIAGLRGRPTMDYPEAWAFVRTTKPDDHHIRCSWRTEGGALLCDCEVLQTECDRRWADAALSEGEG